MLPYFHAVDGPSVIQRVSRLTSGPGRMKLSMWLCGLRLGFQGKPKQWQLGVCMFEARDFTHIEPPAGS